jgi:hypothetical protein
MALYVVSYDLSKPEQDYPQLLEYLHLIGARRLLDSQWLVRSGATRDAVYQGIRAQIDSNDALLVCLVGKRGGRELEASVRRDLIPFLHGVVNTSRNTVGL